MTFLSKNLKFLREKAGLKQDDFEAIGIKKATYSNYENGNTEPKLETIIEMSKFLRVPFDDLVLTDMANKPVIKPDESVTLVSDPTDYTNGIIQVPIIDIESAAGGGSFNPDYFEVLGYVSLPSNALQKRKALYLCVRTRGHSMSPTIFDKDYLIIRYLERGEFDSLRDEYVYVVVDSDGKTFVKRLKNRISRGFIVCMSDNLDKVNYPNFTLEEHEIANIFYVELKLSPHLPNINQTYFDRLKTLEDRMDDIERVRRLRE